MTSPYAVHHPVPGVTVHPADGVLTVDPEVVAVFEEHDWWGRSTVSDLVRARAASAPDEVAYVADDETWTWAAYDAFADELAAVLCGLGLDRGARVALLLPDGLAIHGALVACTRAGLVAVGIGARAGDAEIEHLLRSTSATVLLTHEQHRGRATAEITELMHRRGVVLHEHVVIGRLDLGPAARRPRASTAAPLGPNDVSMLNSTSGTTGLPKCVTQFDNRWLHFSDLAVEAGDLTADDVILAVVPTPFGFGLWTSHFVGVALGARTIVMPRFEADAMARLIASERVTVLCCVSTQFRMLLNSRLLDELDLSSLRVMFTGGEAVPFERAVEFEKRTGATVLQFFGSNETGALSRTTLADSAEVRLRTAGHVIEHMQVRLHDEDGRPLPDGPGEGQPGGRGPLTCAGYWQDDDANRQLYTGDGWMLMGDVVQRDDRDCLTVVGRRSDIIIRGGKNISAAEVEALVDAHPAVALVAVVPVPDPVFGERACAVVALQPGSTLALPDLVAHLLERGVSREWIPEHLVVVDELPRSSGGKIAKGQVRELAAARLAAS